MTNSDILNAIISKNNPKKASGIRKIEILNLAAKYGTADDINKVFEVYGEIESHSAALAYACEYADIVKVNVLLENGARFDEHELPRFLLGCGGDYSWQFRLSILPGYKCKNDYLSCDYSIKYAGVPFAEPEHNLSVEKRISILKKLYNIGEYKREDIFARLLTRGIVLGYCDFVQKCIDSGFMITAEAIEEINSPDFGLMLNLSRLLDNQRYTSLKMLCEAAEAVEAKIMPDKFISVLEDSFMRPELFRCLIERCDLRRYSKSELISSAVSCESDELLSILAENGYFDNTDLRKSAIELAVNRKYIISKNWFDNNAQAIEKKISDQKKASEKRKINDDSNARWFKHKGNTITGISKVGAKAITADSISCLAFPTIIDGAKIEYIGEYATEDFEKLIPSVNTLIIPEGINLCGGKISDYDYYSPLPDEKVGVKTIVFEADSSYREDCIGRAISNIIINKGEKYKSVDGVVFSVDGNRLEYYPRGRREKTYIVPSFVTEIAPEAFLWCVIDNLVISDNVKTLGNRFAWCSQIKRIVFGKGIKKIPKEAMSGCKELRELIFPDGLESIGEKSFDYCGAEHVVFPTSLKRIDKDSFRNSTSRFTFTSDDVLIGPHAFYGCITEGTNYSPQIEGKMQRCGYSKYDRYDEYCGMTRDMAIEKLHQVTNENVDIPETMFINDILKMINEITTK